MNQSHIIEVNGVFLGVAVQMRLGFQFVAVDPHLVELDGTIVPTLEEAQRQASAVFHGVRPRAVAAVAG